MSCRRMRFVLTVLTAVPWMWTAGIARRCDMNVQYTHKYRLGLATLAIEKLAERARADKARADASQVRYQEGRLAAYENCLALLQATVDLTGGGETGTMI